MDISKTNSRIIKDGPYRWLVITPISRNEFGIKFKTVSEHKTKAQALKALAGISA